MSGDMIGIDIGGTTTGVGLVDRDGRLLAGDTIATNGGDGPELLVERLYVRVGELRQTLAADPGPAGIGIGAPNADYHRGTVEHAVNLAWPPSVDLAGLFRQRFGLPAAVTNDANAAALGELLYGAARGLRHVVVVTLGTGLGGGVVVDGRLVHGARGAAGELGHMNVVPGGRRCGCGNSGCLEAYVSATGICRTVRELLAQRPDDSTLRSLAPQELTAQRVGAAAVQGDPLALAAYGITARTLALKLADVAVTLDPQAVILTGGFAASGELLFGPTRRYLEEFLPAMFRGRVALLPSGLPPGASGVLGAAALAWQDFGAGG